MKRLGVVFLMMSVLIVSASCDSDDGTTPDTFLLMVDVVDEDGAPVSGLSLSVAADLPWYQDKAAAKAAVSIPFQMAVPCSVNIVVEDVTRTRIRQLIDSRLVAGRHRVEWNGLDDSRIHMPSGVYFVHMLAYGPDNVALQYEERVPMYMAIIDPERLAVGITDSDGRIELTDKRLFPNLYTPTDIPAVDETGETVGTIDITNSVRFGFHDPVGGGHRRFYADVTGSGSVQFVWAALKSTREQKTIEQPRIHSLDDPPLPPFDLEQPYPIPFN